MANELFPGEWYGVKVADPAAFAEYCGQHELHCKLADGIAFVWVSCLDELCALEVAAYKFRA